MSYADRLRTTNLRAGRDADAEIAALTERLRAVEAERDEVKRQNVIFRGAQKACDDCDAPTMREVENMRAQLSALRAELQRKDAALELCAQAKQDILGWVRLAKAQREAKLPQCKPHANGIRLSLELVDRITAMFESLAALQPKEPPCQTA